MRPKKSLLPTMLVSFALMFSSATMVIATAEEITVNVTVTCATTNASFAPVADKTTVSVEVGATDSIVITLSGIEEAKCDLSQNTHNVVLSAAAELEESFISLPCKVTGCPLSDDDMTINISPMVALDAGTYNGVITLTLVENS